MKTYFNKNYSVPVPQIRGKIIRYPVRAEIKYDGELAYVQANRNSTEVVNKPKYSRHRTDLPLTEEIQKKIVDKGINDIILAGELITGTGKFMTFKKLDLQASFRCFAVINYNGKDLTTFSKMDNMRVFKELGLTGNYLKEAEGRTILNSTDLRAYFDEVAKEGYEGLVTKELSKSALPDGEIGYWQKIKQLYSADLVILGFTKVAKNLSLVLGLPNGTRITGCGNGFTLKQKAELKSQLEQEVVREDRQNWYVKPTRMVEIKHQGIIYKEDGSMSSVRMPVFVRHREDKTVEECSFDPNYSMEIM